MLGQLINNSIANINYPKSKLDIIFLMEQDDEETINEFLKYNNGFYRYIIIPDSSVKTKPNALNYGLIAAKGEYLTVFDAEDIPDKNQLIIAYQEFQNHSKNVACLQAKLKLNNNQNNILSIFFSIEYSIWFGLIIPGLTFNKFPVPLGGTSNHFRIDILRKISGWDNYNVTEDADIGIRLTRLGYKTRTIESYTDEESIDNIGDWLKQRSRWIKGFYQTFLVHFEDAVLLWRELGTKNFIGFFIFIGIQSMMFLILPIILIMAIIVEHNCSDITLSLIEFNFYSMIISPILCALIISIPKKDYKHILCSFIYPIYFLLHHIAAYIALFELITKPFKWNKTNHFGRER